MGDFIVRTTRGEQGPFTVEQLRTLVRQGKLPLGIDVVESDTGFAIGLEDVVGDIEPEVTATESPPTHEATPPDPQPTTRTSAPRRSLTPAQRRANKNPQSVARGRNTVHGKARGRTANTREPFGSGGFQKKKAAAGKWVLGISIGVLLLGFLGWSWLNGQINEGLHTMAQTVNENCPAEIEDGVTIEGASVEAGRRFVLTYTLRDVNASDFKDPKIQADLRREVVAEMRAHFQSPEGRKVASYLGVIGVSWVMRYRDYHGDPVSEIVVHSGEL